MSATLTPLTTDTLFTLFGGDEHVQMTSAVSLRPEPMYWSHFADDVEIKKKHLTEILCHVPRPFILYFTKREDVDEWHSLLKETYQRIEKFHGGTDGEKRQGIIRDWKADKIDGIIANSAFGLGIERIAMRKYGIADIRWLYENDVRFLRQF